jgi:hypothetical protein
VRLQPRPVLRTGVAVTDRRQQRRKLGALDPACGGVQRDEQTRLVARSDRSRRGRGGQRRDDRQHAGDGRRRRRSRRDVRSRRNDGFDVNGIAARRKLRSLLRNARDSGGQPLVDASTEQILGAQISYVAEGTFADPALAVVGDY